MRILIDTLIGLIGLLGGATIALVANLIQRRIGKKKNLFDERYHKIDNKAKARSWDVTLIVLIIAWGLIIIFEGISYSFFILTGVYVLHCISYAISSAIFSNKE